jgi:dTDP-4-dehydrorhamnose 3,5-epimerase
MKREPLPLAGSFLLHPDIFADERGYFKEVYSEPRYRDLGIDETFVQDNVSRSGRGVLRGLHGDPRMAKLVQVLDGEAFDVLVDLRPESPTFLRWAGVHLAAEAHTQVFIPRGFLHGFLALTDGVLLSYKQSATYDPAKEIGVAWNDPAINIDWPLGGAEPDLSPKDRRNPTLRELRIV